jgi:hypothetical protein
LALRAQFTANYQTNITPGQPSTITCPTAAEIPTSVSCQLLFSTVENAGPFDEFITFFQFDSECTNCFPTYCGPCFLTCCTNIYAYVVVTASVTNQQNLSRSFIQVNDVGFIESFEVLTPGQSITNLVGAFIATPFQDLNLFALVDCEGEVSSNCFPIHATCEAPFTGSPVARISVFNQVVAVHPATNCSESVFAGATAESTGYKDGTNNAVFCYRVSVFNFGNVPVDDVLLESPVLGIESVGSLLAGGDTSLVYRLEFDASQAFSVTARGDSQYAQGGMLTSTTNASVIVVVTSPPPQLAVIPASLDMGVVIVGQTNAQSWSIANAGGVTLTGASTMATAGPFSVTSGSPFSLAQGQTGMVVLAFTPTTGGKVSNRLVFTTNGGISSNLVLGTGIFPPGDVNGDSRATGADTLLINQVLVGLRSNTHPIFATTGFANGDINTNGVVSGADSLVINQVLVGLRPYVVTTVLPSSRVDSTPATVTICGIGFPTNNPPAVTIGPPVNLVLTNVVVLSREAITALVPAGGGSGTGTVTVTAATTNGVLSFGRFINP